MPRTKKRAVADKALPYAIYARLSRAADGTTEKCDWQIEMCRRFAGERFRLADEHVYYDNSLSAWKKGVTRPQWDRMMEAAESGKIAGVLVWKVDRFTRRPKDMEALIELSDDHHLVIDGPGSVRCDLTTASGRQQARWMALQAASESDNTSERVRSAFDRMMPLGMPLGGGAPFGFEKGGRVQVPEEAAIVREIAQGMIDGEELVKLAAEMNARGFRTRRGREFTGPRLSRLLQAHRYGGYVERDGEVVGRITNPDGSAQKPILDRDTYEQVQALLSSRRRGRRPGMDYWLTRVLTCSDCEITMSGSTVGKSRSTENRRTYQCHRGVHGCGRSILAEPVEDMVDAYMIDLMSRPDELAAIRSKSAELTEERSKVQDQLARIDRQLVDLEVKYAAGELLDEAYKRAKPVLDRRRQQTQAKLDNLASQSVMINYDASDDWDGFTAEQKRQLIRDYRVKIEVLPFQRGRGFDKTRIRFGRI